MFKSLVTLVLVNLVLQSFLLYLGVPSWLGYVSAFILGLNWRRWTSKYFFSEAKDDKA